MYPNHTLLREEHGGRFVDGEVFKRHAWCRLAGLRLEVERHENRPGVAVHVHYLGAPGLELLGQEVKGHVRDEEAGRVQLGQPFDPLHVQKGAVRRAFVVDGLSPLQHVDYPVQPVSA